MLSLINEKGKPNKKKIPSKLEVDYFIENVDDTRQKFLREFKEKYQRRSKTSMIEVIANFLKFFANKVATCHCSFNVKKGQIKYGERSKLYISVKDPFIKHLNHGHKLTEKDNF